MAKTFIFTGNMTKVYLGNGGLVVLYLLAIVHTKATKELAQPVTQWDYMHYLQKLGDPEPNEQTIENVVSAEDRNRRSYSQPLLHSVMSKRNPQGTLLRFKKTLIY